LAVMLALRAEILEREEKARWVQDLALGRTSAEGG
jgi:hypothetical protein